MKKHHQTEFQVGLFAEYYDQISDTFIDIKKAANSLKSLISNKRELFEIGLGTGYFASMFIDDGYKIAGIQPKDEMLTILKRKFPVIEILGECKLEDYHFTRKHQIIVSHSSVFLFTKHQTNFGLNNETRINYVFQSFITDPDIIFDCFKKILESLTSDGQLFINIQTNPLPLVKVKTDRGWLIFEMTYCNYFFELGYVEKHFRLSHDQQIFEIEDKRFCMPYSEFKTEISKLGFFITVSENKDWIILSNHKT